MAQKTYTMDFVLNAVLNGGFSGVFSQAQQRFVQLGNEIKNLQSVQRDITSYQKQAQAVTNTAAKLGNLERQQSAVRQQIEALKGIQSQDSSEKARNKAQVAALEREYLKYEQRINDTKSALERQKEKLDELSGKLQAAGVDTSDLGARSAELAEKIKGLEGDQKKLNEELANGGDHAKDFGEKGEASMEAVASAMAAAGIAAGLKKIADGFVACVDGASEFGSAMSAVEAISDANERELENLNQKAKETGLTTVYTAKESAKGMEYMAMAGWEAQEMLAGMSGMVNLAAAAGEDLAGVSDIVTDNLTAFNMEAQETNHFADVLAKAAAKSNTNISIMGESFKNSSALAGALGYKIEDVAVGLGLMANSAVKGTRAGTALRNIFNGFVEGMTLTGQSFGEVEVSAINADGSVKGFMETIRELRGYFSQMTGAEKIMNAKDIAGLRGYNGLLAMVNASDEDFEKLYQEINNCAGAAERMAKVKLDNMKGDLTIAKSAWEGLTIAVGEQFEPEMRSLYQTGANVFNQMSGFVNANPAVVKMLAGAAAGIGAVTAAMVGYAAVSKVVNALGVSSALGPVALAAGAVGAVFAVVAGEVASANQEFREMTQAAAELQETLEKTAEEYQNTVETSEASAQVAGQYVDRLRELKAAGKESSEVNSEYQQTLALLLQTMPELSDSIGQTTDEYGRTVYTLNASTDALERNIEAIKKNAIAQAYSERMTEIYKEQADAMVEQQKNALAYSTAQERYANATAKVAELEAKLAQAKGNSYLEQQNKKDTVAVKELESALAAAREELANASIEEKKYAGYLEEDQEAIQAAQAELEEFEEAYKALNGEMAAAAGLTEEEAAKLEALAPGMSAVTADLEGMQKAYSAVYEEAKKSIEGQYALWDQAEKRSATSVGSMTRNQKSQANYWTQYNADMEKLLGLARSGEYDGLSEMMADIGTGSKEAVNATAGLAKATPKQLKAMIDEWKKSNAAAEEAARTYALFAVDVETETGKAAKAVEDMAADMVNSMELSGEAKAAGLRTMAGYLEGLNQGFSSPELSSIIATLNRQANQAMGHGNASGTSREAVWERQRRLEERHYAGGTANAAPGWAVVGENGPEAVRFHGGETVIPSTRTEGMLEGGAGQSVYDIKISVQGAVSEADAQTIKRAVYEAIDEIEEDKKRRGYN